MENKWLENFKSSDSFIFQLEQDVKMFLYLDSVLCKRIYNGFELDEIQFLKSILKPGDVFIDIGANIGLFSLIASNIVGEDGLVYAYEPTPKIFSRLERNILLNKYKNVKIKNIGLSDKKGTLNLQVSQNGFDAWNTFATAENNKFQESIPVTVSTIDDEFRDIEKDKIKFIKIDVEGWEKFVLLGGKSFFEVYSPVVMVEFTETNTFDAGYFVQEIYDIMDDFGYAWFRYKDGQLIPEKKKLHYPYDNLIAKKLSGSENG